MAASVVYSTFGGRVVAEQRGGVIRQYVPDNLGSTIALIDDSGNVTDTYDYWPYGEERVHTGTSTTPLTFLGTLGYFKDFLNMLYVRARHLRVDLTRWMTVDPLWPSLPGYRYAHGAPNVLTDGSGMAPCLLCWDTLIKCGLGLAGLIGELIGDILAGRFPDMNMLCKLGAPCVATIVSILVQIAFDTICPECAGIIGVCAGGALGAIAAAIVGYYCAPVPPCQQRAPMSPCQMGLVGMKAAFGCLGSMLNFGIGNSLSSALTSLGANMLAAMGC